MLTLAVLLGGGCTASRNTPLTTQPSDPPDFSTLSPAEAAFTPRVEIPSPPASRLPQTFLDVRLNVLCIQVPTAERERVSGLWNLVDENTLDSRTLARLYRNGVRVGVGRTERWDAVRGLFDPVRQRRVYSLPPVRTLPGVPLGLEVGPRQDQTVFCVEPDGILSGATWQDAQKVLRVTYTLDTGELGQVFLSVVPEVRQEVPGQLRYDPATGWQAGPERLGRAFPAAGFALRLGPDEFVVMGPGPKSDIFALAGGAFLTDTIDGERYDSYVFVRAEINHAPQRR